MYRLVLLSLLWVTLLAGPAFAECSWVVWGLPGGGPGGKGDPDRWMIFTAYEKLQDCENRRDELRLRFQKLDEGSQYPMRHRVECFPGTIDPRGPKGGGSR